MSIDQSSGKWSVGDYQPITPPYPPYQQGYISIVPWQPNKADWDKLAADIAAIRKAVAPTPKTPRQPERSEEL